MKLRMLTRLASVFGLITLMSSTCEAAAPTTMLLVTTYQIKPDHVNQWLALQKNAVIPALKKAGVKNYATFETLLGDAPAFVTFRPIDGFGQFDKPDVLIQALGTTAAASLQGKLDACVSSLHRSIENQRDEFLIDPGSAPILYASKYRAMPGRSQDYMTFFRNEMMPVMQRAKTNGTFAGLTVTVSAHGGEWGLITLNMFYNEVKALDDEPPVAKTLGPEGTRTLLAKGAGLITPLEWLVHRRVADLSF
jgi:hypothetical protein